MTIALAVFFDERQVALQLRAGKSANALREMIELLATNSKIDDPAKFLKQVLAREQAHPSAVEHEIAFPHAHTDLVDQIVPGIGRSRAGIPFGKGGRARLIFVIGAQQRLVNDYLICVGTLLPPCHFFLSSRLRARSRMRRSLAVKLPIPDFEILSRIGSTDA